MVTAPPLIWILTSGRRGDIVQCRAIAERLSADGAGRIEEKTVRPRAPYRWFMPYGPPDPAERALIAPPYPDLVIASGRRTVPYVRMLHRETAGKCRAVFMKYPGCDVSAFALMWTPAHDRKEGPAVMATLTAPHLATPRRLARHREKCAPAIAALPAPRLGIVLGGNTRRVVYGKEESAAFSRLLAPDLPFSSFAVSGSRRTPANLLSAAEKALAPRPAFIWDGTGENPYFDILANCDAFLVTGDSHNLVSEVLACGRPVHVFRPRGNPAKFDWTLAELEKRGLIVPSGAPIAPGAMPPCDATDEIAAWIGRRLGW